MLGIHCMDTNTAEVRPPNFILIVCDNLGYGDIQPFGSKLNETPHLMRMEREGRKFTHFYVTAGVCTPSRASFMTGCYPQRVGMHTNPRDLQVLRPISPYGLHPDEVTIAEVLKKAGYHTGIIGKWHLGDQAPFLPHRQGFDFFYGVPYSDDMTQAVGQSLGDRFQGRDWPPLPVMLNDSVVAAGVDRNLLTQDYTTQALSFIEANHEQPFFLYIPQAMPGSTSKPFASAAFRGKSRGGPWGDSVEELDWSTGMIINKLRDLGIAENTLVIFTSDNGSPMGEDPEGTERGTNKPLHGRGYTTSEGAFRAPTLMWWPGVIPAGTTCEALVSSMDFLPTFAHLADVEVPDDRILDGHDITSLIKYDSSGVSPYEVFYYYSQAQLQAVRKGPWKLFLPLDHFENHPHFKGSDGHDFLLFNVENDIGSQHNLAERHPQIVEELNRLADLARRDLGDVDMKGENQRSPGYVENPKPVVKD